MTNTRPNCHNSRLFLELVAAAPRVAIAVGSLFFAFDAIAAPPATLRELAEQKRAAAEAENIQLKAELADLKKNATANPKTKKSVALPVANSSHPIPSYPETARTPVVDYKDIVLHSRFRKLESLLQVAGCEACGEMSRIESGSFKMGAAQGESEASVDEKPRHGVTLKAFELGRTVVTQGQWKAVMGNNPSKFKEAGDAYAVENVTWNDAQEFIRKLNQQTGKNYRLPIEAEWESAARAGTTTAFWWGNSINPSQANYDGSYNYNGGATGEYRKRTVKADAFKPNPWGLYNVHGNVWQWVQDTYHGNYESAPDDGRAWEDGSLHTDRNGVAQWVLRGGSWDFGPWGSRSAYRRGSAPDYRSNDVGLRIARTL